MYSVVSSVTFDGTIRQIYVISDPYFSFTLIVVNKCGTKTVGQLMEENIVKEGFFVEELELLFLDKSCGNWLQNLLELRPDVVS